MKRFYCTICKKIKRVRKYPILIDNMLAETPAERRGMCNFHSAPRTHSNLHTDIRVARKAAR